MAADALSRKDKKEEAEEEKLTLLIALEAFLRVFEEGDYGTLKDKIVTSQQGHQKEMRQWEKQGMVGHTNTKEGPKWRDAQQWLAVPPSTDIWRRIMAIWHNHLTVGHQGRDETVQQVQRQYF